jgi:hypothetical protein
MTFQGGQSESLSGRSRGARSHAAMSDQELFDADAETVLCVAGEMARAGNRAGVRRSLLKWLRAPVIPPPVSSPPRPQAGAGFLGESRRDFRAGSRSAAACRARAPAPRSDSSRMRSLYVLVATTVLS